MHQMPDQHRLKLTPHANQFLKSAVTMRRPNFLQQMAIQQQQLVHHLQLSQRQYMLQHGIPLPAEMTQSGHPTRGKYILATSKEILPSSLIMRRIFVTLILKIGL